MSHQIRRCISHYKAIFLLNCNANLIFGSLVVPYLKLILSVGAVVGLFTVIRLHEAMDALPLVLASVLGLCSICVMVPIAIVMSSMYKMSTKFRRIMNSKVETLPNNRYRMTYLLDFRSCPLIRCKIGSLYHMEAKAKVTWFQKLINGTKYTLVYFK